jgi:DNA (cytosine-5)-methyltransferase 1
MRTVAFCEIDPFCRRVLAKHWPHVPCYDDVRSLTAERLASDGIAANIICGGFPCQDISWAGLGAGIAGSRSGLWADYARIVGELRPDFVVVENVTALLGRGLSVVLGDLAALGYDAEWQDVSAEDIGAPHPRSRVWIVAYPSGSRLEGLWCTSGIEAEITHARRANDAANASFVEGLHRMGKRGLGAVLDASHHRPAWAGQQWPETQPLLYRVDDGVPDRVDRTSALGNAVVPQIPELIGRAIMRAIGGIEP